MNAERIRKIRESKEAARIRQYNNFQASGDDNYYRKMSGYEEIVEICDQALSAADDHTKAISITADLCGLASKAAQAVHQAQRTGILDHYEAMNILKSVMAVAERHGWSDRWE